MKNIVLIGMMGCGKTTCANLLHERLGRPVVDTDALIVEREGRSVSDIFAAEGESYFRDLETAVAKELSRPEGLIIATGGGLPLREENRAASGRRGVLAQAGPGVHLCQRVHGWAASGAGWTGCLYKSL